jgi:dynein light chain LC8-type
MLEGKAVIGETDMLPTMQQDALDLAAKALDFFDATDATDIARFIKQVSYKMHMEHACCLCGRARARAHAGIW